jgi:hypothetical protein
MTGAQLRYCAKVGIAAGLGYLLTQGNLNQYAIYSAFTAALVVGTSMGEDLATSANRVKGTLGGTAAAMVATALFGPLEGRVHDALAAVVKAWHDLNREKRVRRSAIVEEGQVDTMLRLGLDVLSCALQEPRADSLQNCGRESTIWSALSPCVELTDELRAERTA